LPDGTIVQPEVNRSMHAVTQSLVSPLKQTERKRYSAWAAHGGRDALSRCARPGTQRGIIDAVRVGLCILAITPVISLYRLNVGRLYPGYLIWGRTLVRLALAGVLYYLRPREEHWKPVGDF